MQGRGGGGRAFRSHGVGEWCLSRPRNHRSVARGVPVSVWQTGLLLFIAGNQATGLARLRGQGQSWIYAPGIVRMCDGVHGDRVPPDDLHRTA